MPAYVTLSFDDGFRETVNSVLPILEKNDFVGSFNIITDLVGKTLESFELSSWDEIRSLAHKNNEIASHNQFHIPLASGFDRYFSRFTRSINALTKSPYPLYHFKKFFSKKQLKQQYKIDPDSNSVNLNTVNTFKTIVCSKKQIDKMVPSQTCKSFVYPGGTYCKKSEYDVKQAGYSSARSMKFGYNKPGALSRTSLRVQTWYSFTTVDEMNRAVDKCVKNNLWLIECYHLVGQPKLTDYEYFTSILDFEKHLKYLKRLSQKGLIVVDTQKNIFELLEKRNKT